MEKGVIRQFVAMPLGSGYSAEEQITGSAEFGGVQVIVYPMRGDVYERRFPKIVRQELSRSRKGAMPQSPMQWDACAAEEEDAMLSQGLKR